MHRGEWATEDVDTWRACAGTALHEWLQDILAKNTGEDRIDFEVPLEYGGIPGHADMINWTRGEVTDLKFPSLKSARLWADPDVLAERFTQPMGYCAAARRDPRWTVGQRGIVRFLICPVDGTFADWKVYERPFDPAVADLALDRYNEVKALVALQRANMTTDRLPRDKPYWFCQRYCEFFSLCRGGQKDDGDLEEITDPMLAAAVEEYGLAREAIRGGYKTTDQLRPVVEGLRGRARGWKIYFAVPGRDSWVVDEEAVRADYARRGEVLPMKQKDGGKPAIYVKRDE